MGFLDDASNAMNEAFNSAKGALSNVALEQFEFVREFCQMISEGCALDYHERNGGNASMRLTSEEVSQAQSFFTGDMTPWNPLNVVVPEMAQSYLLVTAAGCYMKDAARTPATYCGIVVLNELGNAWRVVWGFKNGGQPTSEIAAHIAAQGTLRHVTSDAYRVLYHAHPKALVALTAIEPAESSVITNILWRSLTESVIAFPAGLGVIPWMVPGSEELARATADMLHDFPGCIWQMHGMFASGASPKEAFELVHAADKAAQIYLSARCALGGSSDIPHLLSTQALSDIATRYGLQINQSFLLED